MTGVLLRSKVVPAVGTSVGVKVADNSDAFIALGKVVRIDGEKMAIMFFEEYPSVIRFIDHLQTEK